MKRGRPIQGAGLVDGLDGSQLSKQQLAVIMKTLTGEYNIATACAELGIGKSAFCELRHRVLQAALEDLSPRPMGRPRREVTPEEARIEALEEENARLKLQLETAWVREEIILAMPQVFKPELRAESKKKEMAQLQEWRRQAQEVREAKKGT